MNPLLFHSTRSLPARLSAVHPQFIPVVLATLLLAVLSACGGPGSGASASQPKKVRLAVGKIKEVDFRLQSDTTLHLYSSSENKEIVDVSRAESAPEDVSARPAKGAEKAVFYIKGVSPGRANVVFSEKKDGQEGPGRTLRTYSVEVVSE